MERIKDTIDWQLIQKRLDGTLSEEEKELLEKWAEGNPLHQNFLKRAESFYQKEKKIVVSGQQIDMAWERFKANQTKQVKPIYKNWSLWATAASILIALCCWQLFYRPQLTPSEVTTAVTNILPGSSKGYLILSDGRTIPLGGTQEYGNITDKNASIRLDSCGIAYGQEENATEAVYNTIKIPQGGEYKLTLADGTIIWLNSETELIYPASFSGKERRVKLTGEAYFEVTKDTTHPFVVETGDMQIKVLGTSFNVHAYNDEHSIVTTLVTGKVSINAGQKNSCILTPSQQANFNKEKGNIEVKTVKTSQYTQWKEGRFVFRNKSLKEIMKVLARWYNMKYEFVAPEVSEIQFYGTINRYEQVNELLKQFEKTGKVRFNYSGGSVLINK